ncbi:MAG: FMN-binding protein [Lawsonibacter sp.]
MTLSLILAWIATLCAAMTALKFLARISKIRAINRFFSKCHIPFGVLMLVTGLLHGILAGNPSWATLSDVQVAPVLFSWNWGTVCLLLTVALAATYLLRKRLKKRWMTAHRALTAALLVCLALHLANVGIQLPDRLAALGLAGSASALEQADGSTQDSSVQTDTSTPSASGTEEADGSAQSDASAGQESSTGSETDASTSTDPAADSSGSASSASGSIVTFSGAQLNDGSYQGSAQGYRSTITVSVTVSGGQVSEISVISESDTPQYFSRAEGILDTIVSSQSLEVDAVSGATFSSAGIINAVSDALQGAVESGTLQVTNIDLTAIRRH